MLLTETVEPARDQHRHDEVAEGMKSVESTIAARRAEALDHAREAVGSSQFRDIVLEAAEWIAAGPWTSRGEARTRRRAAPVEKHAAKELSRRRRKISRRGRALKKLDPRQRHKLRIQAKKLRYASEFFAGLFPGKAAKKRRKNFVSALKGLQGELGHLNDIAARQSIGSEVAGNGHPLPARRGRNRAYASGLLIGEQEAQVAPLLKAAAAAHSDFRKAKPFWK